MYIKKKKKKNHAVQNHTVKTQGLWEKTDQEYNTQKVKLYFKNK